MRTDARGTARTGGVIRRILIAVLAWAIAAIVLVIGMGILGGVGPRELALAQALAVAVAIGVDRMRARRRAAATPATPPGPPAS